MRKELFNEIEVPENVNVSIDGNRIKLKGPQGENEREFNIHNLEFKQDGKKIIIGNEKATKKEKRNMNSITAHIKNMILGVQNKYEYQLKICFVHFPMTVEIKGNKIIIKNFLGEKTPRESEILDGVEVKAVKEIITVKSVDKEKAGQTAANLEKATFIRMRDRRVFQDGIYIINKAGEEI